jgi:hypothetical protein
MFSEEIRFQSILVAIVARVQDCEDSSEFERKFSTTSSKIGNTSLEM